MLGHDRRIEHGERQDIRTRKIDDVVVYKVDRLTRALMDFAKIVETFDQQGVSCLRRPYLPRELARTSSVLENLLRGNLVALMQYLGAVLL